MIIFIAFLLGLLLGLAIGFVALVMAYFAFKLKIHDLMERKLK